MLREPAKDQRHLFERSGLLLDTQVEHLLQTYTHSVLRADAVSRRVHVCCACRSSVSFAPVADSPFLDFCFPGGGGLSSQYLTEVPENHRRGSHQQDHHEGSSDAVF
jgi:hypothetical protein